MTSSSAGHHGPMRDPEPATIATPSAPAAANATANPIPDTVTNVDADADAATATRNAKSAEAAPTAVMEPSDAAAAATSNSTTTPNTNRTEQNSPSRPAQSQPAQHQIPPNPSTPPSQRARRHEDGASADSRVSQGPKGTSSLDQQSATQASTTTTTTTAAAAAAVPQDASISAPRAVDTDHMMVDAPTGDTKNNNSASDSASALTAATSGAALQSAPDQATPVPVHMESGANMANADQFAPSTPFTPAPMSSLNQHAYMMMALASMSGAPSAMSPPPTVTPSQVTLPNVMDDAFHGLGPAHSLRPDTDKALESFARIEFADSVFQMTTYAVIIGRDQRALEQARRDEKRAEDYQRRVDDNVSKGLPPPSPIAHDRSKFSKSYVSEEGGMLGPESDSEGNARPAKRRKTSTNGSSEHNNDESQENMISNRQYVSHTPGAAAVDLASLRPSPWHVPFIGIHSPGPNIASKTKAISREHLKIAYNQKEGVFEAIPLHKNGFFCEDVHYKSDKVVLKCGDRLQIKDIDFRFLINGVEKGRTGAEEYMEEEPAKVPKKRSHGGKEMSFDFESSHGNGEIVDTSDELSDVDSPIEPSDFGEDDDAEEADEAEAGEEAEDAEADADADADLDADADAEMEEAGEEDEEAGIKHESLLGQQLMMPQIPRKRGPGRPPKNGIMSKREQRLLKKQQQEMAKKTLPQAPPVEPPIKRKVGRPRKHPLPENGGDRPEKRKYKPRKPKDSEGAEGSDAERRAREKKEKKVRPKSPPLELKIEDYTEEQLQKPNKNYGVLIDETLTAAGPDGLTLKQIYKRICQRYPWFYFHTETKGWESSVRHNLIGNEAFKKDETTNLWSRVPGVELDAGKKRKASSPDRGLAAQAYGPYSYSYNTGQQHMAPGAPPGFPPGQAPPPGYQIPGYNTQPGQAPRPMQPYGASASPPGQAAPAVPAQPPAPAQLPGYGPPPAPARPQLGGPQPGTYSSPYASRPPPPANAPIKREDGHPPSIPVQAPPQPMAAGAKAIAPGPAPTQQHPQVSNKRPSATPPSNAPPQPVIDPRLLQAVVSLKNGLIENLKKARNPKAEAIVMSAINRCLGLKKDTAENEKMEMICTRGLRQVIDGFTKTKSPTPGGSSSTSVPPPDTPAIFEPRVFRAVNGFKDVSIKALKAKLGEAKAEAVTLSAIDRALGFAESSVVAPPAEGEQNLEGVEQHLIKSLSQLLTGMNQKLHDSSAPP